MKKKTPVPKRTRVNMRFPTDLLVWAKGYAEDKNMSVTQLLVNHLTELRDSK